MLKTSKRLSKIYNILYKIHGPRNWWPADSPFEVIVGAVLTQNTSWENVKKAIANLKRKRKLSPRQFYKIKISELSSLIKSCGYHNIKAKRLKSFIDYLFKNYKGSLSKFFSNSTANIRKQLLAINGIGPETADSILLYAAGKAVFVVDAYTKRILERQGLIKPNTAYEQIQQLFENNLPKSSKLFNEYHALIVEHAKWVCKKKPICSECALRKWCSYESQH
ncbi:MAG: endonuclease III domain-containing protein [Candidatus Omnitrophota bacterium]|nr:MAG: endonuclease III domain-containing protein [Candidatus Omnitrophota bacterium]